MANELKVIFIEEGVIIAEAKISPKRVAKAGVIQLVDSFFTFSRFDNGDAIFSRVDLLPLDDSEVKYLDE